MEPLLQVQNYWSYPNRFELVQGWWNFHERPGEFTETAIPKMAVIITSDGEPACLLAASMDNSIGKATLEYGITAPGQTASQARRVLQFAESALFSALKPDYGLAQTFTSPAIARTLERNGWTRVGETVHLIKEIT